MIFTYLNRFFLNHVYERVHPIVSTSLFTVKLKLCPNSLRMTPESQKL